MQSGHTVKRWGVLDNCEQTADVDVMTRVSVIVFVRNLIHQRRHLVTIQEDSHQHLHTFPLTTMNLVTF